MRCSPITYSGGVENSKTITNPINPTIIKNVGDRQGDDCLAIRIEFLTTIRLSQKLIKSRSPIHPHKQRSL
ncbi:MAG: hypothetical protein ACK47G_15805 [Pseudanabaena sp.]